MDSNNVSKPWTIARGQSEVGKLWVMDDDGNVSTTVTRDTRGGKSYTVADSSKSCLVNTRNKWHCLGGLIPHAATEFTGQRFPVCSSHHSTLTGCLFPR